MLKIIQLIALACFCLFACLGFSQPRVAILSGTHGHRLVGENLAGMLKRAGADAQIFSIETYSDERDAPSGELIGQFSAPKGVSEDPFVADPDIASIRDFIWRLDHFDRKKFVADLKVFNPTQIIATAWKYYDIVPELRNRFPGVKIANIVTDYVGDHLTLRLLPQEFDFSFFPSQGQRLKAQVFNSSAGSSIRSSGIIIDERLFLKRDAVSSSYGQSILAKQGVELRNNSFRVLMAGGNSGLGPLDKMLDSVLADPLLRKKEIDLVIVGGANDELVKRLQTRVAEVLGVDSQSKLKIFVTGRIDDMALVVKHHFNLLFSKPGGVTTTEGMALLNTITVFSSLVGFEWEDANLQMATSNGTWLATDPANAASLIFKFSDSTQFSQVVSTMQLNKLSFLQANYKPWQPVQWVLEADSSSLKNMSRVFLENSLLYELYLHNHRTRSTACQFDIVNSL